MSDPKYISASSSFCTRNSRNPTPIAIPKADRIFKSSDALLCGTPFFWEKVVIPKLNKDCGGLYRFLADSYPNGVNPCLMKTEENVDIGGVSSKTTVNRSRNLFGLHFASDLTFG